MLPPPTLSFTIPSIHDDTLLDCRIYNPRSITSHWERKCAIIAHPYAPLGGCYDDPVVDIVASVILKQDFVVGTFNFRGAGSSKGRTSWTAKPETDDYKSFVGFMVYYLQYLHPPNLPSESDTEEFHPNLTPIPSRALPASEIQPPRKSYTPPPPLMSDQHVRKGRGKKEIATGGLLLLAGYSYGSLITTCLPSTSDILVVFSRPDVGSAASEIRLRAEHLARQQSDSLAAMALPPDPVNHGRRSLQIDDARLSPSARFGGEETSPGDRRSSHEGRRSLDTKKLRRSLDKIKYVGLHPPPHSFSRHSNRGSQSSENPSIHENSENRRTRSTASDMTSETGGGLSKQKSDVSQVEPIELLPLRSAYLLISPLQGLIKELATMSILHRFNNLLSQKPKSDASTSKGAHQMDKLAQNDTLAIFGTADIFTSEKKLYAWARKLENQESGPTAKKLGRSKFRWREVEGADHFWHNHEDVSILRDEVKTFIRSL